MRLSGVFLLIALAACGSSPTSSFYTLSPDTTLERLSTTVPLRVSVGPVTVPELVDKPQIVTRRAPNEVSINEFARWGEPVKENIARTLAADMSRLLGSDNVSIYPQGADVKAYAVRVDVMRFDSTPADSVTLDALWTIRAPDGASRFDGHTVVHKQTTGDGFDAIAAAHSRAVSEMSKQIAAAIVQMRH
ncbi:membrane integrity-associated transporter subunit PqiC [Caballeronia sp. BR00000012568055]|uniref:PqiC family protein n=1 Tax=Caballeronia sp. BR00000012568055 TaxID=2918761 RepID=UPI0023F7A8AC|nr:PqiC family protein [Caballeronia sp. BR00000012568055]